MAEQVCYVVGVGWQGGRACGLVGSHRTQRLRCLQHLLLALPSAATSSSVERLTLCMALPYCHTACTRRTMLRTEILWAPYGICQAPRVTTYAGSTSFGPGSLRNKYMTFQLLATGLHVAAPLPDEHPLLLSMLDAHVHRTAMPVVPHVMFSLCHGLRSQADTIKDLKTKREQLEQEKDRLLRDKDQVGPVGTLCRCARSATVLFMSLPPHGRHVSDAASARQRWRTPPPGSGAGGREKAAHVSGLGRSLVPGVSGVWHLKNVLCFCRTSVEPSRMKRCLKTTPADGPACVDASLVPSSFVRCRPTRSAWPPRRRPSPPRPRPRLPRRRRMR